MATDAVGTSGVPRKSIYAILTLNVDSNLNDPTMTSPGAGTNYRTTVEINEDIDFNYIVFNAEASDNDLTDPFNKLVFSLTGQGKATDLFTINQDSGIITLKKSLLQENDLQYIATLIVEDGGSPPRKDSNTGTVTINVIRNNNAPQWESATYKQNIPETSGINANVIPVRAVDPDRVFNVVKYEIIGDDKAPAYFKIDENTGLIQVRASLAGINDEIFYVRVRAYDNGSPPMGNTTVVTVTVERNLQAPVLGDPTVITVRIPETQELGLAITRVNATDADSQAPHKTIKYRAFADTKTNQYFGINTDTGDVYVKRSLQLDTQENFQMFVQAYDEGTPSKVSSQNATIDINVLRNKFAPAPTQLEFNVLVPETATLLENVQIVTFNDADTDQPYGNLTLSVIGDGNVELYFDFRQIKDSSQNDAAQIRVKTDLTTAPLDTYTMRIQAKDGGTPAMSGTAVVVIKINRNLFRPVFAPTFYTKTISELTDLGEVIVKLNATDNDMRSPNNITRYLMSKDSGSLEASNYFLVDYTTGEVRLRQSLMNDPSKRGSYNFDAEATDLGSTPLTGSNTAQIAITVNRNRNSPIINNLDNTIEIFHNRTGDVYDVAASDADTVAPFNTIEYDITGDDGAELTFRINSTTGVISLATSIFPLTTTSYKIRVRARDGGVPRLEDVGVLTVNVKRNFNVPVFNQNSYNGTVREDQDIGSSIIQVLAGDVDSDSPYNFVNYKIDGGDARFLVDPSTGWITVRRTLTGETQTTFTFNIFAEDGGTPAGRSQNIPVTITVQRNLQTPVFNNLPNSIRIQPTQSGTFFTANATDDDTV
ncbi:Hypothetical predicted protein, partial [Mytilus galloprovincialis]